MNTRGYEDYFNKQLSKVSKSFLKKQEERADAQAFCLIHDGKFELGKDPFERAQEIFDEAWSNYDLNGGVR